MELIDKKQAAAFKRLGRRIAGDPSRLRMTVCVLLTGIGIFGVERPLGLALAKARADFAAAKKSAQMAEEVAFFTREHDAYQPRVSVPSDITDWQNYILERLRCTTATLIALEPHKPLAKGVFTVLEMEVVAKGTSYREFTDFVDRIEHGERLVRIEKLRMEKQQATIYMTCLIRGLVRGGPKPGAGQPAEKSAAHKSKPIPPEAAVFVGPLLPGSVAPAPSGAAQPATDAGGTDGDVVSQEGAIDDGASPDAGAEAQGAADSTGGDESPAEPRDD